MIHVELENRAALQALQRLQAAFGTGATPFLQQLGDTLVQRIDRRFSTATDPDGLPWAPNSPVTLQRFMQAKFKKGKDGRSKALKKDGTPTKAASTALASKKPLIAQGTLRHQIAAELDGPLAVLIKASQPYAGVHQFGAKRGAFGADSRGHPLPWGNIPARRFMPLTAGPTPTLSATEARFIEATLRQFIENHTPD